jgi:hypothetical protein
MGLTLLLSRQCPSVALVPFQQGAVNLFAGIANRPAYSEKWDETALPPINDGASRCPQVQRNLTLRHERARGIESRHAY